MPAQFSYVTPVFFRGARVPCEVRGVVTIVGLSDGPLPWPIGEQDGVLELVVYRGLAAAVKSSEPEAVAERGACR